MLESQGTRKGRDSLFVFVLLYARFFFFFFFLLTQWSFGVGFFFLLNKNHLIIVRARMELIGPLA